MEQAGTKEFSRLMTKTTQEKDLTPMPLERCAPQNSHKGGNSWTLLLTFCSAWHLCCDGLFFLLSEVTVQPEGRPSLQEQRPHLLSGVTFPCVHPSPRDLMQFYCFIVLLAATLTGTLRSSAFKSGKQRHPQNEHHRVSRNLWHKVRAR